MHRKRSSSSGKEKGFFLLLTGLLAMMLLVSLAQAQELLLVDVEIPEGYQQLKSGDSVLVETQIILVGTNTTHPITDVLIEYIVKDKEGNIINSLSETKGGVVRIQTVKELHLPNDLPTGTYSVTTKASVAKLVGQNSASFKITKDLGEESFSTPFFSNKNLFILLLVGLLGLFFFSAYQFWKIGKLYKKR